MYGCPPGCYARNGTTSVCAGAPAASYALYGGSNCSTSANALESCPRATYSPSVDAARSIACRACPTGSFCPYSGMPHPGGGVPLSCTPSTSSPVVAATSPAVCTHCPPGTLPGSPGSASCTSCSAGTHCLSSAAVPLPHQLVPATSPPPAPATATAVLGKLHPLPGR